MEKLDLEIIKDIKLVASQLNQKVLGRGEYTQSGRFSVYDIYDGGNTWEDYCDAVGIKSKKKEPVPDEVYFERLKQALQQIGRLPKTSERKRFGLNFSKSRYPTLGVFIDRAIERGIIAPRPRGDAESLQAKKPLSPALTNQLASHGKSHSVRPQQKHEIPPIPKQTKRKKWERIDIDGFPYAPQEESGVVALFAILCSRGYIGWKILDLRGGKGIDAICYDSETKKELQVELKYSLSRATWNHSIGDVDYVVCWLNRWPDFQKPVIELSSFVRELKT